MQDQDDLSARGWNTLDEIKFLSEQGTHQQGTPILVEEVPREKRLALLLGYKSSMPNRVRWGFMDKNKIAEAVDQMISKLQR
ncbi:MAG: hypothetical protein A3G05_00560 [Candidatus Zambryskibacteria bacterium RIFCSPLOWO2_12_FULL_45_14]|uniref:Uncharacterized protein n=2 Tax=Candidatus Zambryskiibacteriota TaxID=1817925 RepID=A0A1G2ULB8_9BACT|nr:MAG: hypothetical protein A3H60_01780 [Candidatus Zambryskibacteria bacterium RIFCSPLOWO2_02_FULL_44_12b]OHB13570.1 MAG: hypothetical protein A3G05_00560 [Candidatus Zambryskibacteria bacterium RIFCSPLOWO2_12_FULL_45_14]